MASTLTELTRVQREFDSRHGVKGRNWTQRIDEEHVPLLLELTVALTGEVGEFANLAKKVAWGDFSLQDGRPQLALELADIFIYLLKLSDQLGIDLETEFHQKMNMNEERFKRFLDAGSH